MSNIPKGYKQTEVRVIPEDWEVKKLVEIAPLQRGFDLPENQLQAGNYSVVYYNGIDNSITYRTHRHCPNPERHGCGNRIIGTKAGGMSILNGFAGLPMLKGISWLKVQLCRRFCWENSVCIGMRLHFLQKKLVEMQVETRVEKI